jgi:CRISPR system Cascade subunit CasA
MSDGTATEFSLRDIFAHAHEIRGLNEPSPLAYTAVMRFLLAIVHRAIEGPEHVNEWIDRWEAGRFDRTEIDEYLDRWSHRFDLFDPVVPFAQAGPDVAFKDDSPVSRLFMERTSGNNPTLFDHAWDEEPPALSAAEAARALLTAHAYAFAGSGGRFFNAPMIAGYSILLEGNSLFQTLMLNLQEYSDEAPLLLERTGDAPWWEIEPGAEPAIAQGGNRPRGLTDLLTWQSRYLRLIVDDDGRIRRCYYSQRYQLIESQDRRDPFKRYEAAQAGENKGKFFPRNFSLGRALWRDSAALIEQQERGTIDRTGKDPRPGIIAWLAEVDAALNDETRKRLDPTIVATGLVNNQARIDLWRMDRLPLPVELLNDRPRQGRIRTAIEQAQAVRNALNIAGSRFATEGLGLGERKPDPADVARERASLKLDERYWSQLDVLFQEFLIDLAAAEDPAEPLAEWSNRLEWIARRVYVAATDLAGLDGRWFRAQVIGARVLDSQLSKALGKPATNATPREAA